VRRASRPSQPALPRRRPLSPPVHSGLEVRPVHYTIQVHRAVPTVEIELLAINYLTRPVSLREVKIMRFTAGSIPVAFDNIPLAHEVTLEPRSCFLVSCERLLSSPRPVSQPRVSHSSRGSAGQ